VFDHQYFDLLLAGVDSVDNAVIAALGWGATGP